MATVSTFQLSCSYADCLDCLACGQGQEGLIPKDVSKQLWRLAVHTPLGGGTGCIFKIKVGSRESGSSDSVGAKMKFLHLPVGQIKHLTS